MVRPTVVESKKCIREAGQGAVQMPNIFKTAFRKLEKIAPTIYYLIQYRRAANRIDTPRDTRDQIFNDFIDSCKDLKGLQIAVKDDIGQKFGANWTSVDKFDEREFIDFHYDIHDLQFPEESFDAIVCISVLEHVTHPQKAIEELSRVLKPGGRMFIQLPFHYHYHASPNDYWRVSPEGLRIWMEGYEEIAAGHFRFARSSLATSTFYLGTKQ